MIGIALVGLGVVWQNMFPASPWGWAAIGAGLIFGMVTRQIRPSRTPLDRPALLLALMGGVSLWATAFPEITWAQVARLWSGLIGAYAVSWWANSRARLTWTAWGLIAAGVVMALFFIATVLRFWRLNLIEQRDIEWLKNVDKMVGGDDHNMPEQGKYNGGQKLVFWLMTVSLAVLLITGVLAAFVARRAVAGRRSRHV